MNLLNILDTFQLNRIPSRDYGTDKNTWHTYISNFYEERFLPYKEQPISLLEIGIETGASLKLWGEYFSNAISIVGVDLSNGKLLPEFNSNATIIEGDAYSNDTADSLGDFDIIIDDASHNHQDHLKFFELYIQKLKSGGILVIEDIQRYEYFQDSEPVENLENNSNDLFDENIDFQTLVKEQWVGLITKFNEVCQANNLTNLSYEIVDLRNSSQRYDDLLFVITAS